MKIGLVGYIWRYAFYFIVVVAAIYGLLSLMERFAPGLAEMFYGSGASTGLNVAALMLPGIYVGQKWARTEEGVMPRGFAWVLALLCACVAMALSAGLAWFVMRTDAGLQAAWRDIQAEMDLFWIILVVMGIVLVLLTRLMFWSAIRGERKRQARLARKAS